MRLSNFLHISIRNWYFCLFEGGKNIHFPARGSASGALAAFYQKISENTMWLFFVTDLPVAERIICTHNRDEFFCDGSRNLRWLRERQTRGKCATRYKRQYTVKKHDDMSEFFSLIRARPPTLTP